MTERLCSVSVASCSGGSSAFVRSVSAVMLCDDMEGHVFVTSGVKTSVTAAVQKHLHWITRTQTSDLFSSVKLQIQIQGQKRENEGGHVFLHPL